MTRLLVAVAGVALAAVVLAAPVPAVKKNQWLFASDGHIYLFTEGDKEPKKLTDSGVWGEHPAWSPDGKRVAFCEEHDTYSHICVMGIDGKKATQLASGKKYSHDRPSWTADGKRIAFQRTYNGESEICTADSSDGSDFQVVNSTTACFPSCSPDGKSIAFLSNRDSSGDQLYKLDTDGQNETKLLDERVCRVSAPAWSPNGKWIAFSTWRPDYDVEIYVVRADGTDLKPLTKFGKMALSPSWSPDGSKIAFVCDNEGERERQTALWVMDADGGNQKEVLKLGKQHIQAVAWRPK